MTIKLDPREQKPASNFKSSECGHTEHDEEQEYDPYDHLNDNNTIGTFGAVIHIIRMTVGVSILATPLAQKRVGFLIGICESLTVGILYYHIVHILIATEYKLCRLTKFPQLTLIGTVNSTFKVVSSKSRIFEPFVKVVMNAYYGIPCNSSLNLIIISSNLKRICKYFWNIEIETTVILSAVILPLTLLCWIRKLKFLVPLSAITNVLTFVILCIIFGNAITSEKPKMVAKPIADISFIPRTFAMLIGAYRCTGICIPLKHEMKNPRQFSSPFGVVNIAAIIIISLNTSFGVVMYWKYGDDVQDNIILNLPNDDWLPILLCSIYTPVLCVCYFLNFYVCLNMYWDTFLEPKTSNFKYQFLLEYLVRTAINIATYIMAVAIPKFGLFASLSGTLGILAEIGVPPLLEVLLMDKNNSFEFSFFKMVKNILIVSISILLFISSINNCVKEIIKDYS